MINKNSNNFTYPSISSLRKSILMACLIFMKTISVQAIENSPVNINTFLCAGMAMCLGSKFQETSPNSLSINHSKQENKPLALTLSTPHTHSAKVSSDGEGKKLMQLYLYNHHLAKHKFLDNTVYFSTPESITLDFSAYLPDKLEKKSSSPRSLQRISRGKSSVLKRLGLGALCMASLPTANANAPACAACTSGVCAATLPAGPLAFGLCVVEAAATICFVPCTNPFV